MYIIIKRERGIVMNINYDEYVKYIEEIKTDEELEELEKSINSLDESPDKTSLLLKIAMKKVEIGYTPKIETTKKVEKKRLTKTEKGLIIAIACGSAALITLASAVALDKKNSKTMTEATIESTMDESANVMDTTSATEATTEVTPVTTAATEATTVEPTTESSTTATTNSGTYEASDEDDNEYLYTPKDAYDNVDMYNTLSFEEKRAINVYSKIAGAMVNYAVDNNITLSQSMQDYASHLYMITDPESYIIPTMPATQAYVTNLYNDHTEDAIQPIYPEYYGADLDMFYTLNNDDRNFMNLDCYATQGFVQYAKEQNVSLSQAIADFKTYTYTVGTEGYSIIGPSANEGDYVEDDMVDDYTNSTEGFTK